MVPKRFDGENGKICHFKHSKMMHLPFTDNYSGLNDIGQGEVAVMMRILWEMQKTRKELCSIT